MMPRIQYYKSSLYRLKNINFRTIKTVEMTWGQHDLHDHEKTHRIIYIYRRSTNKDFHTTTIIGPTTNERISHTTKTSNHNVIAKLNKVFLPNQTKKKQYNRTITRLNKQSLPKLSNTTWSPKNNPTHNF